MSCSMSRASLWQVLSQYLFKEQIQVIVLQEASCMMIKGMGFALGLYSNPSSFIY